MFMYMISCLIQFTILYTSIKLMVGMAPCSSHPLSTRYVQIGKKTALLIYHWDIVNTWVVDCR